MSHRLKLTPFVLTFSAVGFHSAVTLEFCWSVLAGDGASVIAAVLVRRIYFAASSRTLFRSSSPLIAFSRHLQQANIDSETARHSRQLGWPHRLHLTAKRGQSGRLLICEFGNLYGHAFYLLERVISQQRKYRHIIVLWCTELTLARRSCLCLLTFSVRGTVAKPPERWSFLRFASSG